MHSTDGNRYPATGTALKLNQEKQSEYISLICLSKEAPFLMSFLGNDSNSIQKSLGAYL